MLRRDFWAEGGRKNRMQVCHLSVVSSNLGRDIDTVLHAVFVVEWFYFPVLILLSFINFTDTT